MSVGLSGEFQLSRCKRCQQRPPYIVVAFECATVFFFKLCDNYMHMLQINPPNIEGSAVTGTPLHIKNNYYAIIKFSCIIIFMGSDLV